MSAAEHKLVIRRFVETVWNAHDPSRVGEFHAERFTLNGELYTPERFATDIAPIFEFLGDFRETIDAMVAEEDRVAYRWTQSGTDPRTHKRRSWHGMSMSRLFDGKIVEEWYVSELSDAEADDAMAWLESRRSEKAAETT